MSDEQRLFYFKENTMFYPYNNVTTESRNAWKSAYEIQAEALEYEKLRLQLNEGTSQTKVQQRSGWFKAPQLLLSILFK
jgi:hypothetical protein